MAERVVAHGGEVLLDQRVRLFGSHHQNLVVLRHRGEPERDVAFVGGIDLCHSRRDNIWHRGDPQAVPMSARYGSHPAWHDVQLEIRGPAVAHLELTFRERWADPTPLRQGDPIAMLRDRLRGRPAHGTPLPPTLPVPPPCGGHAVQVLRTYPRKRRPYPFAPHGERTVARGYLKAIRRARRLIYVEDQYLWSREVAGVFADALRVNRDLHLVVAVPRFPDIDDRLALPPNLLGRQRAMEVCRRTGGDRLHVLDVENHGGTPVHVHAKVCVIDDVWASVGSDNINRRSWSHDSELSCAVPDSDHDGRVPKDASGRGVEHPGRFARQLRLALWREHLDRDDGKDDDLVDPLQAVEAIERASRALDNWYRRGRRGPRPAGRLLPHRPPPLSAFTRGWASIPYRFLYDPAPTSPVALRGCRHG